MKALYSLLLIFLFFACSSKQESIGEKPKEEKKEVISKKEPIVSDKTITYEDYSSKDYSRFNPRIQNTLRQLDSLYSYAPYYFEVEGEIFYVVCKGEESFNQNDPFNKGFKFGIVDAQLKELLPIVYDKIYNIDLTLGDYLEIEKSGKVGLFNIYDKHLIEPQFEYILPVKGIGTDISYGLKDKQWYEVRKGQTPIRTTIDITTVINQIQFNTQKLSSCFMKYSYEELYDGPIEGNGILITPSYMLQLATLNGFYNNIIPEGMSADFGTEFIKMEVTEEISISDQIVGFFISFYDQGIDGRGYSTEKTELLVYNTSNNAIETKPLTETFANGDLCQDNQIAFKYKEALIEIRSTKSGLYNYQPHYSYLKTDTDGKIIQLRSNRQFPFTEFVEIDESYFEGCFANSIPDVKDIEEGTHYQSVHLTINDLDIMRNEIFASYGYTFKSKKWQDYFAKFNWYRPKHDNVDDQLSDLEKKNIELILKVKEAMKGREEEVVKRSKIVYVAAG